MESKNLLFFPGAERSNEEKHEMLPVRLRLELPGSA